MWSVSASAAIRLASSRFASGDAAGEIRETDTIVRFTVFVKISDVFHDFVDSSQLDSGDSGGVWLTR
jgi:hypothetical protein